MKANGIVEKILFDITGRVVGEEGSMRKSRMLFGSANLILFPSMNVNIEKALEEQFRTEKKLLLPLLSTIR